MAKLAAVDSHITENDKKVSPGLKFSWVSDPQAKKSKLVQEQELKLNGKHHRRI